MKWRQRWFALKEDKLWYCQTRSGGGGGNSSRSREKSTSSRRRYRRQQHGEEEDEEEEEEEEEIGGREYTFISLLGVDEIRESVGDEVPKYCFEINAPHQRYHLRASSRKEMSNWLDVLNRKVQIVSQNQSLTVAEFFISDTERAKANRDIAEMKHRATVKGIMDDPIMTAVLKDIMIADDVEHLYRFLDAVRVFKRQFDELAIDSPSVKAALLEKAEVICSEFITGSGRIEFNETARRDSANGTTEHDHRTERLSDDAAVVAKIRRTLRDVATTSPTPIATDTLLRFSTLSKVFDELESAVISRVRSGSYRKLMSTKIYRRWIRRGRAN